MDRNTGLYTPCEGGDFGEFWAALEALMKQRENPTVEEDENFKGHRVIFTQAEEILKVRYVSRFPVYPLLTALAVHTDMYSFEDNFKQLLEDAMKEFGPVVEVSRLLFREDLPNCFSKNWKVLLGVPEKHDLELFQRMGLPDNMTLKLPGYQREFKVTFCCSTCNDKSRYSHTTWNCFSHTTDSKTEAQSNETNFQEEARSRKRVYDTDSIAREIGEEQVRSSLGDAPVVSVSHRNSKRSKIENKDRIEETQQVSTSSLTYEPTEVKSEMHSTDENDSNLEPPQQPTIRRKRNPASDMTVRIPEIVRQIIQDNPGVLDVDCMEAFFNHVKKKASPCEVASRYTEDVEGFKEQLQRIKERYYNGIRESIPVEVKRFMKWFESMLERFDQRPGTKPRKRVPQ